MKVIRPFVMVVVGAAILVGVFCALCIPGRQYGAVEMGSGAVAAKTPHQSIRMDSQEVTIRLGKKSYVVEAAFRLFNTGETTTQWIGFPKEGEVSDLVRFDAWHDGRYLAVTDEPSWIWRKPRCLKGLLSDWWSDERWLSQHVKFRGRRQTAIRVSYEADYRHDIGGRSVLYRLGTASDWKDNIARLTFTIDGQAIGGAGHFRVIFVPRQWQALATENAVRYESTDYKPHTGDGLVIYLQR